MLEVIAHRPDTQRGRIVDAKFLPEPRTALSAGGIA